MASDRLIYRIPGASWTIELPLEALDTLQLHAQRRWWSKEAAGQLFSHDPASNAIRVDTVTTLPHKTASRTGLRLNIRAVAEERELLFEQGLHCLGFWHTHPELTPSPSAADIELAAEHARAGGEAFAGLVFVILGTSPVPKGLGVWVHDGTTLWRAVLETEASSSPKSALLS